MGTPFCFIFEASVWWDLWQPVLFLCWNLLGDFGEDLDILVTKKWTLYLFWLWNWDLFWWILVENSTLGISKPLVFFETNVWWDLQQSYLVGISVPFKVWILRQDFTLYSLPLKPCTWEKILCNIHILCFIVRCHVTWMLCHDADKEPTGFIYYTKAVWHICTCSVRHTFSQTLKFQFVQAYISPLCIPVQQYKYKLHHSWMERQKDTAVCILRTWAVCRCSLLSTLSYYECKADMICMISCISLL